MLYGERYGRDVERKTYLDECKGEDKYEQEKSNMKEPTEQQLKQALAKIQGIASHLLKTKL